MGKSFSITNGLYTLVPDAKFIGDLSEESQKCYDLIKWLDYRPKPSWEAVEQEGLKVLKKDISDEINIKTSDLICTGFKTSLSPNTSIKSTTEWQFDMLNMWLVRDTGMISFPYQVHVGSDEHSTPIYITLNDSKDLNTIYTEMFSFITNTLDGGRKEKSKLDTMTVEELENYQDER